MGIFNRHRHLRPEILSEYLDGRLDQRHQNLVARRLAGCPACQENLNTLQATVSALQSLPDLPLPRSFTLPTAPSPDYPAVLIRKPAPLIMRMPGWAYGGAASLAGLALALMLSAEAAGLASPASFQATGQAPAQAPAAAGDAAMAEEAQGAQIEADVAAPEMANQAEAPADTQAATAPQAALRAEPARAPEAATEMVEPALAAKTRAEPAGPTPQTAMAQSQGVGESVAGPAGETATDFSATLADAGVPRDDDATAPEEFFSSTTEEAVPAEEAPVAPVNSDLNLAREAETPVENLEFAADEFSARSSPPWWKALEAMFAALTLAFLGGLFFRWRRNRRQYDA